MADSKQANVVENDGDTKIEAAAPLADATKGEISPAADQSNRGAEMAALMAVTVPKVKPAKAKESTVVPTQEQESEGEDVIRGNTIVKADGTVEYIDPDTLEQAKAVETFPNTTCINCRNHGRGDVALDANGFCKQCGFKLNKISNTALEPAPVAPRTATTN